MTRITMVSNPPDLSSGIGIYTDNLVSYLDEVEVERVFIEADTQNPYHIFRAAIAAGRSNTGVIHIQHDYVTFGPMSLYSFIFFPVIFASKILTDKSVIITMHEPLNADFLAPPLRRIKKTYLFVLNSLIAIVADQMVFLTERGLSRFQRSVSIVSYQVIPHGVHVERTISLSKDEAKLKLGYEPSDIVISEPGYIEPRKGNHIFLSIADHLPEYEFVIAGGSPRKRHYPYERKLRENAPPNVRITGQLTEEDFHAVFSASDLVVLPYLETVQTGIIQSVNQSGVFNWCVAYGNPVVASDFPFFHQLYEEWNCVELVDPLNPKKATKVIKTLIENEKERNKLIQSINKLREEHSLHHIARQHEEIYHLCEE